MSPLGVTLFTVAFASVCILFGDYYGKLHFSYGTWLVITIITAAVFVADIIFEQFIQKDKKEIKE